MAMRAHRHTESTAIALIASVAAVAIVTGMIALVEPHVPVLSLGALYVFAVLPIAVAWGLAYAIPVSVASMLAFNWFFLPPVHTFTLADSRNWFALAVFLVTAVVVSDLAARSRRRSREAALLARIASLLLERGGVTGELDEIAIGAAAALRVERARIVLEPGSSPVAAEVGWPLEAAGRRVGTIFLEHPRPGSAPARRRVLPALASMLAVAIDRERLELDAVEADTLRHSDAIKTAVLRAVSHDLRSPLMAISTSAGTLLSFHDALAVTERRELLETILAESERLDHVVGNLLDLSRLQAGALQSERTACSADELVLHSLEQLGESRERVEVTFGEDAPTVTVDARQIERVLVNLIENALKFSPADAPVRVTVTHGADELVVRVDDKGPGLGSDELERVFEPFHRGSAARVAGGAGLGLAIARGFAEANGGRVWAESAGSGGASFSLAIPAVSAEVRVPA